MFSSKSFATGENVIKLWINPPWQLDSFLAWIYLAMCLPTHSVPVCVRQGIPRRRMGQSLFRELLATPLAKHSSVERRATLKALGPQSSLSSVSVLGWAHRQLDCMWSHPVHTHPWACLGACFQRGLTEVPPQLTGCGPNWIQRETGR